jgi:hypothetical protein
MSDHRFHGSWMALWLAFATMGPAMADGPRAGFKLDSLAPVFKSPDQTMLIEQYAKDRKDGGLLFQFWTFDGEHHHARLLNPGEDDEVAGYAAGFRFSPDSQWLVRIQKLSAGYATLFLYQRTADQFSPATKKPLGDLAWDFFFKTPDSKGMHRNPKDLYSLDHATVALVKGMEENYASMGQHWPNSRYVVVSLNFDIQGQEKPSPWIEDWWCVYDLKTGAFSVPADFAENNAKAIKQPSPKPD